MRIGDLITWKGQSWVLRGLEPMSIPNRCVELEDEATGERIQVPIAALRPRD